MKSYWNIGTAIWFSSTVAELSSCHSPHSRKCLISGPLWKKFANPWSNVSDSDLSNKKKIPQISPFKIYKSNTSLLSELFKILKILQFSSYSSFLSLPWPIGLYSQALSGTKQAPVPGGGKLQWPRAGCHLTPSSWSPRGNGRVSS